MRWAEVSMTCVLCDPQPVVLKPGNSWSQQSVHHFICVHQDDGAKYSSDTYVVRRCSRPTSCFVSRVYSYPSGGFLKRTNITPPSHTDQTADCSLYLAANVAHFLTKSGLWSTLWTEILPCSFKWTYRNELIFIPMPTHTHTHTHTHTSHIRFSSAL